MTGDSGVVIPGWYGKLPALGDFASRRLPAEFIQPWDEWLQVGIQQARSGLGEAWLDCYLTTPIWRFALLPGLIGPGGWAGVLMPSVDRVGRQFPLTLAAALPSCAAVAHAVLAGADWFAGLEEAALAMLDVSREPDDLDRALEALSLVVPAVPDLDDPAAAMRRLPSADAFEAVARAEALRQWASHGGWTALWWTRGRVDDHPLMLASPALPAGGQFAWLLQSRAGPAPETADPLAPSPRSAP